MDPPLLRQMVTRGEDKVQPKLSAEAFLVFPKYLCASVHSQQTHNGTCHKTVNVTLIWGTTLRLDCCGLFHKNAVWSVGCRRSIFHAAYWNSEYSQIFFKSLFSCISVLCTDNVALGSQKNSVATNKISRLKTDAVRNLRTWEALIKTVKWKSVPASEASFACVHICDHFVHYSPTLHDLLTGHYLSSLASIWPCNPAAVALVSVLGSTVTQADTMVAL